MEKENDIETSFLVKKTADYSDSRIALTDRTIKRVHLAANVIGIVTIPPHVFPASLAALLQMYELKHDDLAPAVATSVFVAKGSLCIYFSLATLRKIFEDFAATIFNPAWHKYATKKEKNRDVATFFKRFLLHLCGVGAIFMFPMIWEKTYLEFIKLTETKDYGAFFTFLGRIFKDHPWLRRLSEGTSGLFNFVSAPSLFAGLYHFLFGEEGLGKKWQQKTGVRFTAEFVPGLVLLAAVLWGMSHYPLLMIQLMKKFLGFGTLASLPFNIALCGMMVILGIICAMPIGMNIMSVLIDLFSKNLKWSKGETGVNTLASFLTLVFTLLAGIGIMYQSYLAGQNRLTQAMTLVSGATIDILGMFALLRSAFTWLGKQCCLKAFDVVQNLINHSTSNIRDTENTVSTQYSINSDREDEDDVHLQQPTTDKEPGSWGCCTIS